MGIVDISLSSLLYCSFLLIIPIFIGFYFTLSLTKTILYSAGRMAIQLALIGIFLKYLFKWNNAFINLGWLVIMIFTAVHTVSKRSSIKFGKFFPFAFISFFFTTITIILYINIFVLRAKNVFEARYIVVMSGMLLGNTLRSGIIGLNRFYSSLKHQKEQYNYYLGSGASHFEAILPFLRESMLAALNPTLATMLTMGIVTLPGMMTGTILGGSSPLIAIKYQIIIMIGIFVCTSMSVLFTILLSLKPAFTGFGIIKDDFFRKK